MNRLPSFADFLSQINIDSFSYDINRFSTEDIKQPTDMFTNEQYAFLMKSYSAMSLALLQSYHSWLTEQLEQLHQ
jgi:hypothetical protein|nr:MAG TPA: hypothetical protein [Caudoviricetes sp.]